MKERKIYCNKSHLPIKPNIVRERFNNFPQLSLVPPHINNPEEVQQSHSSGTCILCRCHNIIHTFPQESSLTNHIVEYIGDVYKGEAVVEHPEIGLIRCHWPRSQHPQDPRFRRVPKLFRVSRFRIIKIHFDLKGSNEMVEILHGKAFIQGSHLVLLLETFN